MLLCGVTCPTDVTMLHSGVTVLTVESQCCIVVSQVSTVVSLGSILVLQCSTLMSHPLLCCQRAQLWSHSAPLGCHIASLWCPFAPMCCQSAALRCHMLQCYETVLLGGVTVLTVESHFCTVVSQCSTVVLLYSILVSQ